jgi:hypothetical protein
MLFEQKNYPNLHADNYQDTGPPSKKYNCIAWAAGIDNDWWDPAEGRTWPGNAPRGLDGCKVESLIVVFESVGFVECADSSLEQGVEKIAIYAIDVEWMHAARQLESGKWTSKMGVDELIEHDTPEDLVGPAYGQIVKYMQRNRLENA